MERKTDFSKRQTIKCLRRFLYVGGFLGAYSQIAMVMGPIFTGYALWLGLTEAHIAIVASFAALAGLVQPFSLLLSNRIRNKKRFVVGVGFLEIGLVMSVVTIPLFVPAGVRMPVLIAMVLLGTTMAHIVSPTFSGWSATMIPENIRGGVEYLAKYLRQYRGETNYRQCALALACYNAGPNAVKQYGGVPPFPETRRYVVKVTQQFHDLDKTGYP